MEDENFEHDSDITIHQVMHLAYGVDEPVPVEGLPQGNYQDLSLAVRKMYGVDVLKSLKEGTIVTIGEGDNKQRIYWKETQAPTPELDHDHDMDSESDLDMDSEGPDPTPYLSEDYNFNNEMDADYDH